MDRLMITSLCNCPPTGSVCALGARMLQCLISVWFGWYLYMNDSRVSRNKMRYSWTEQMDELAHAQKLYVN